MKLIIGLGNPGRTYDHTRHNVGFDVIDILGDTFGINVDKEDFLGLYGYRKIPSIGNETVILFKPLTFMNLSGNAVQAIRNYFKIDLEDIIVVFDDMDTEVGEVRVRFKGSSGGHKGIQDIIRALGTEEINRIRVGIGKPEFGVVDYVLSRPKSKIEKDTLEEGKHRAKDAVVVFLKSGIDATMNRFN